MLLYLIYLRKNDFFPSIIGIVWKTQRRIPSKDKFYNTSTNHPISEKLVWKTFNRSTIKDYHNLYLKVDVSLLACMPATFRNESTNSFELELAHHYLLLVIVGMQCYNSMVLI